MTAGAVSLAAFATFCSRWGKQYEIFGRLSLRWNFPGMDSINTGAQKPWQNSIELETSCRFTGAPEASLVRTAERFAASVIRIKSLWWFSLTKLWNSTQIDPKDSKHLCSVSEPELKLFKKYDDGPHIRVICQEKSYQSLWLSVSQFNPIFGGTPYRVTFKLSYIEL